jgi:acyl-CoA synthetase (NDP forming)
MSKNTGVKEQMERRAGRVTGDGISAKTFEQIDGVLARVEKDKRRHLFEHEVYEILELIGLNVPRHRFVERDDTLCAEHLQSFTRRELFIKVVSEDILHKARVGGVKRIANDAQVAKWTIDGMRREIPLDPSFSTPPDIRGFLLLDRIIYSEELGNELLIGFKENNAFGPVLSVSKGGSDAEHFARYYSSPNLKIVPLSKDECCSLVEDTRIYLKYCEEGKLDYVDKLADAIWKLNQLAHHYSSFNPEKPRYVFTEFEVNPIVFDRNRNLIALDGLACVVAGEGSDPSAADVDVSNLEPFFKPRGVAVVGVSATDSSKMGNIIADLLAKMGREDLHLLNVKGGSVTIREREYPLHKSLMDIQEDVELVVVAVPAKLTPPVVEDCRKKKVKSVILIPGGFGEVSGDNTLEQQIRQILRGSGIRVVGPNCLGVIYAPGPDTPGINTFFIPEQKIEFTPRPESNMALITQSGAVGVTVLDHLKHSPYIKALVSYGNQLDVDPGDLVAYFESDPAIDVIGVYVEGFRPSGGRAFFDAARKAEKPIIVYKAGRTDAGSRAAASHTASMTGDYDVAKASFLQAEVVVTEHILYLTDFMKAFALTTGKKVGGRRVAGIVNAGFESTYAADSIGELDLATFSDETTRKLREILPPIVGINPFLDLTPMANDEVFENCIDLVLADPNVDSLFISIVPHTTALSTVKQEMETRKENLATRIIRQTERSTKPIMVSVNAGDMYNLFVNTLEEGRVPTYPTARRAMQCLNALVDWHMKRQD